MYPIKGLSIIVARASNRVIGQGDRQLPWRIPSDLKRFKAITMGHPVIMGRKTWESVPEKYRPLPGRTNIILTKQEGYTAEGAIVACSLEQAQAVAKSAPGAEEVFVIGGEDIYRQFFDRVGKMYVTTVDARISGDRYFPILNLDYWECIEMSGIKKWDQEDEYATAFDIYVPRGVWEVRH
jgi:dihydrofolate reductase